MKIMLLVAVFGISTLFTACSDDSSSSPNTDPQNTQTENSSSSGGSSSGECFTLPEPNGTYQSCYYTYDDTSVTEYEITAVGVITRTWTVKNGIVYKTTDNNDGNEPSVDEERSMESLDEVRAMEKELRYKYKSKICDVKK